MFINICNTWNWKFISYIFSIFVLHNTVAQHQVSMQAVLDTESKTVSIKQQIEYVNDSEDALGEIFFYDWTNSFSNKTTALGERFSEDFVRRFYYAKKEDRGATDIKKITDSLGLDMVWSRPKDQVDIIKIELKSPLNPGESTKLLLEYLVKIPNEKFTRFGFDNKGNFSLKYWFLQPAVYDTKWNIYSNKNLNDIYAALGDYQIELTIPSEYIVFSELKTEVQANSTSKIVKLKGDRRNQINIYLTKEKDRFHDLQTNKIRCFSNIDDDGLASQKKSLAASRIIEFLEQKLGAYPFDTLILSENDYKNNPVYGLNQLPDIFRPFPDGFQYEVKLLKTISDNILNRTLLVNRRYDKWIKDAIHIHLMIEYIEKYYPKMKIIGSLSKVIGIRWFHAADIEFNDQYFLAYKNIARLFLDQSLDTPGDELVKFNANIANAYKAGIGLKYLENYLENDTIISSSIQSFYKENSLKQTSSEAYRKLITAQTSKKIDWFFDEYIGTKEQLDFKIKSVKRKKDSLLVTIKGSKKHGMPVSLYGLKDKKIVSKTWIDNTKGKSKITIANNDLDKLALDYEQQIPEINRRNNYRNLKWIFNKPFQFRLLQDVEDPRYSQVFFIPEFRFNVYDGFTVGSKFYNKTVIRRQFDYKITPFYGLKSNRLLGSAGFIYRQPVSDHGLYQIRYGFSGNMFSYAPDLLFRRFSPNIGFLFRPKNLRSNLKQSIFLRSVNVFRDRDEANPVNTPDYSVFNARYVYSDLNLTNFKSILADYQIAKNFSKVSTTINYRKLFLNNRALNFRLFVGAFLYNNTQKDGDFFSFALDRPTDYLFDFNYLGRSEDTGFNSQQIILAEGGFKSKLDTPFANQWITTFTAETNIWNWIYTYGDIGYVKNKGVSPQFVFDAGVRLSLVQDYFELFFPIVSNKGWEIAQPNYDQQIRFIVTLSPQTLIKLFTRKWY